MEWKFDFLEISIFIGCSFSTFKRAIEEIYSDEIYKRKGFLKNSKLNMEYYSTYRYRGFPKFSFWENTHSPQNIYIISDIDISSLCNIIHKRIGGVWVMCTFSNELKVENPSYKFHYSDSNFNDRDILAYKEDKWVFYEQGRPLAFENTDYYKNRLIKKRLNNKIIEEYLLKLGINIWDIDSQVDQCITYQQNAW